MLPVPNLLKELLGTERCLSNWKILHMSLCRFLRFSESTAFSSLSVHESVNSGAMKNWANMSRAPSSDSCPTSKKKFVSS